MKFTKPITEQYHFTEKESSIEITDTESKQLAGAIPIHTLLSSKDDKKTLENYGIPVGLYVNTGKCNHSVSGGFINIKERSRTNSQIQSKEQISLKDISDREFEKLFSTVSYSKNKPRTKTMKIRHP
jgi:hypothetical protein